MRAATKGASVCAKLKNRSGLFAEQICFCGKFDRVNATSRGTLSFINLSLSFRPPPPLPFAYVALTFRIPLDSTHDPDPYIMCMRGDLRGIMRARLLEMQLAYASARVRFECSRKLRRKNMFDGAHLCKGG